MDYLLSGAFVSNPGFAEPAPFSLFIGHATMSIANEHCSITVIPEDGYRADR